MDKVSSETLIIFTRYPVPGKTKTRLIPTLGEVGAVKLQKEMTEKIAGTAVRFRKINDVDIEIHYADGNEKKMRNWLDEDFIYKKQGGGDIGEKMNKSLKDVLNGGAEKAVLIGTDCPVITVEILESAFDSLSKNDVVLGPAGDGGYYLVGMKKECLEIFQGINWGSSEVLNETISKLKKINLSLSLVEILDDIDRPEDVKLYYNERNRHS